MDADQIRAELEAADKEIASTMTNAEFSARRYGYWLRAVQGALRDPAMPDNVLAMKYARFREARDAFVRWRIPA